MRNKAFQQQRRRHTTAVVLLAGVLVVGLFPHAGAAAVATEPTVISGFEEGPLDVPGGDSPAPIATMDLAKGRWMLFAKAYLVNTSEEVLATKCRLVAGGNFDETAASTDGDAAPDVAPEAAAIAAQLVHNFSAPSGGEVSFHCASDGLVGQVKAYYVRITAVSAGRVRLERFGRTPTTFGPPDALPKVLAGYEADSVSLQNDGQFKTLGKLAIPAGNWAFVGKLMVRNTGAEPREARCRLVTGSTIDEAEARLGPSDNGPDRMALSLVSAHRYEKEGLALIQCATVSSPGQLKARGIRLTAVRAGRLSSGLLNGWTPDAVGKGSAGPRVHLGANEGPVTLPGGNTMTTVGTLGLTEGSWTAFAKLTLENNTDGDEEVTCRLETYSYDDEVRLQLAPSGGSGVEGGEVTTIFLNVSSYLYAGFDDATLKCSSGGESGSVVIHSLRIMGMRASSVWHYSLETPSGS
jgi:hypothetical protein